MDEKQDFTLTDANLEPGHKTMKPIIAGILLIVAAAMTIFVGVTLILIDASALEALKQMSPQIQDLTQTITNEQLLSIYNTCGIVGIVLSIFMILGGIISIKRKFWGIALTSSIVGLVTFLVSVFSVVPALIALIILMLSKNEFE